MAHLKELKAYLEIGQALNYTGEALQKYVEAQINAERQREADLARIKAETELAKIKAEADEKERQREAELAKLKAEADEKERQREAELAKMKSESEARIEIERLEYKKALELADREADKQLRLRQMELDESRRSTASGGQGDGEGNRPRDSGPRTLHLPLFDEAKDDLDAYLNRFERACEAYDIRSADWCIQLARLLQGRSLEVFQRMDETELRDYSVLKENLLKRFQLNCSGYRKKFKESRIETGESPKQFSDRLRRYFLKWLEMAGYKPTFDDLVELMVKDQYFLTCGRELQVFLKEQGVLKLDEMLKRSEGFIDAHGPHVANWNYRNDSGNHKNKGIGGAKGGNKSPVKCDICGRDNHKTSDHRDKPGQRSNPTHGHGSGNRQPEVICFSCKRAGHRSFECPNKGSRGPQSVAAMQVVSRQNSEAIKINCDSEHHCSLDHDLDQNRIELKCGCCLPILAGAWSVEGRDKLDKCKESLSPCCLGLIGNREGVFMRDTGASICCVKQDFIQPEQLTGEVQLVKLLDSGIRKFPVAVVKVESRFYSGTTRALVVKEPVADFIIGQNVCGTNVRSQSDNERGNDTPELSTGVDANLATVPMRDPEIETCSGIDIHNEINGIDAVINHVAEVKEVQKVDSGGCSETLAAVQTRAMAMNEGKPLAPLKVPRVTGLDLSPDEFQLKQKSDETLCKLWEQAKRPMSETEKSGFVIRKELLYRVSRDKRGGGQKFQLVVPTELRSKVMELAHNTLFAGHRGNTKTFERISADLWFPCMFEAVRNFNASCDQCQRNVNKGSVGRALAGKLPLVGEPFSEVSIDLVGPLSPPSDGNRFILTLIDTCTRYPEAVALKQIDTQTVAEALITIFSRVGLPRKIHSDNGSQFVSDLMKAVYQMLSIKSTTASFYHPQGNGTIENLNKTLKNMLKKMVMERPKDWSRYLVPIMFALRDTPQSSTGFSPFELLYGRTVRTPMMLLKELWSGEITTPEDKTEYQYVIDLRSRIEETCALAREELSRVQDKTQKYANRKSRPRNLRVGDDVLLLLPTDHNKLLLGWRGPYKVVSKVGLVDYRIELPSGQVKTFHINMLKKYNWRSDLNNSPGNHGNESVTSDEVGNGQNGDLGTENVPTVATVACVLEDEFQDNEDDLTVKDSDLLPLYTVKQKETWEEVKISPKLSEGQQNQVRSILREYAMIFSDVPSVTHLVEHKVVLTQKEPVKCKGYPIPYQLEVKLNQELDEMLAMGIIERSEAPYAAPLVLVKKPDGTFRTCVNFKELNKITVFDPEPMMSADDIFHKLSGSKFYSTFDFCKGYWQIPMEEKSKDYTTFTTSRGLMRFRTMPFGMVNAGSTYNRMVRKLLDGTESLESYIDDIIEHTGDWDSHVRVLTEFCERVKQANLSLKPSKCRIGFDEVDFLGHTITTDFIGPQSETVGKILNVDRPRTKRQCRSLLGLVNFYRRYIPHCAEIIAPLSDLTKNKANNIVEWGDTQETAFTKVKEILSSAPILKLPDISKEFILQTDASNSGIGACLFQMHDGVKHPVMYASKKLLSREQNYSVGEREALAIVWAIQKFHRFLYGRHFVLETDHRPLQYLSTSDQQSPRLMRWSLALQPYRYTINYVRGEDNFCADYLSRC